MIEYPSIHRPHMSVDAEEIIEISNQLIQQYPNQFSDSFEQNKQAVEDLTNIHTHHTQNRIAGHITRKKQGRTLK